MQFLIFFAQAEAVQEVSSPRLWDVLYGGSLVNLGIWGGLLATSILVCWFAIEFFWAIREKRLLPQSLTNGIHHALGKGDLTEVLFQCQQHPVPLGRILNAAFKNSRDGYEIVKQSADAALALENEHLQQQVNRLNVCGQIAPMLGLMGTVTGMVMAFSTLASATGAAKSKLLAQSISTALWTTCAGLIVAVPALLFYTILKNRANSLMLQTENCALHFIKIIHKAKIVSEP